MMNGGRECWRRESWRRVACEEDTDGQTAIAPQKKALLLPQITR